MEIQILNDFEDFFANWAEEFKKELQALNSPVTKIVVDAGPFRSYGMEYDIKGTEVHLDFYSGVRNGFGSIGVTPEELAKEIKQIITW